MIVRAHCWRVTWFRNRTGKYRGWTRWSQRGTKALRLVQDDGVFLLGLCKNMVIETDKSYYCGYLQYTGRNPRILTLCVFLCLHDSGHSRILKRTHALGLSREEWPPQYHCDCFRKSSPWILLQTRPSPITKPVFIIVCCMFFLHILHSFVHIISFHYPTPTTLVAAILSQVPKVIYGLCILRQFHTVGREVPT